MLPIGKYFVAQYFKMKQKLVEQEQAAIRNEVHNLKSITSDFSKKMEGYGEKLHDTQLKLAETNARIIPLVEALRATTKGMQGFVVATNDRLKNVEAMSSQIKVIAEGVMRVSEKKTRED